ncbi:MAG: DUF87 domain-containing protein [Pseudomonadota bacterium]
MLHKQNIEHIDDQFVERRKATPASIGRIVSVTGSEAIIMLDAQSINEAQANIARPEMGAVVRIDTTNSIVFGLISGLSIPVPSQNSTEQQEVWIAEVELVGELGPNKSGEQMKFSRGVTLYPNLGDKVYIAASHELELIYSTNIDNSVSIGQLTQDPNIPAMVRVDELLGKHFAVLGSTGTGKSCTVALIFQEILKENSQAHILLLDPHNEYASSFKDNAEVISPSDLHLPFWLLTFEEIIEILVKDKSDKETQIEILSELIPVAKTLYGNNNTEKSSTLLRKTNSDNIGYSVDTPSPYRISDLLRLINERMGKLDFKKNAWSHTQLKNRIESLTQDPRYSFMFGSLTVQDHMADVLARLFRIPVQDKPITILQLTGLPSEVVNVVVSVLCRMTFDFALWSDGLIPITLVCEEAHRYIPVDTELGFEPTRRSIARIAKEGRKYGVSLCIISQRPSELDPTILSQCNTVFAMRMSNERDQQIVSAAVADAASGLLEFLPSLGTREAIAFGDGMTLSARIRLSELDPASMPKGRTAPFTEKWRQQIGNEEFLKAVIKRWRASSSTPVVLNETVKVDQAETNLNPNSQ